MPMWSRTAFISWVRDGLKSVRYSPCGCVVGAGLQTGPRQELLRRRIRIHLAGRDAIHDAAQLAGRKHPALEMIHEPLRHQLAQTVLAALVAARGLTAGRVLAEAPDRLDQL